MYRRLPLSPASSTSSVSLSPLQASNGPIVTIGSDSDTEPSPPPSPEGFPGGYSPYQSDDDLQDDQHLRQPPAQDIWVLSEFFTEHRGDLGFILLFPSPPSWEVGVVGALAHAIRSATDPSHHERFYEGFSYFVRTLYAFFSDNIQQVGPMVCYPYPGWALGVIRALSHVHRLSWDPRKVVDLERRLSLDLLYPEQFWINIIYFNNVKSITNTSIFILNLYFAWKYILLCHLHYFIALYYYCINHSPLLNPYQFLLYLLIFYLVVKLVLYLSRYFY